MNMRGCLAWGILIALVVACSADALARAPWRDENPKEDPPSPVPDRVILTWAGDPSTTQAVTWRTDLSVQDACALIALAGVSSDFAADTRRIPAKTGRLDADVGPAHYHSVKFTDLNPNTLYAYRVGSDEAWSEWFHFRTASADPEPFSFLYFGDPQDAILPYWSRVIRAAYTDAPNARFMIYAGDLVTNGVGDAHWAEWFDAGGWILGMTPTLATPGNHEYDRDHVNLTPFWRTIFTLPENGVPGLEEQCYFVDYQGVRVISLNSNEKIEDQAAWLEGILKNNPSRWTVVIFHHPVFSSARGRDNRELRESWKPLFDRYGVDLVLQGHDHNYGRGRNLPERPDEVGGCGTMYIVSVSGPKMYDLTSERWMDRAGENVQLYQVVDVTADTLNYRSMTVTGDLYDAFDLVKQKDGPNLLIETLPPGIPEYTFPASGYSR